MSFSMQSIQIEVDQVYKNNPEGLAKKIKEEYKNLFKDEKITIQRKHYGVHKLPMGSRVAFVSGDSEKQILRLKKFQVMELIPDGEIIPMEVKLLAFTEENRDRANSIKSIDEGTTNVPKEEWGALIHVLADIK